MDSTAATIATAVNPTVAYVTDKLGAGLMALAESLKVPASEVWRILVTQATVEGWMCLGICGMILVLWAGMVRYVPRIAAYERREGDYRDATVTTVVSCIVGVGTVVAFLRGLWLGVLMTSNPEYYALEEILQVF